MDTMTILLHDLGVFHAAAVDYLKIPWEITIRQLLNTLGDWSESTSTIRLNRLQVDLDTVLDHLDVLSVCYIGRPRGQEAWTEYYVRLNKNKAQWNRVVQNDCVLVNWDKILESIERLKGENE
jgi:hypothetical protein